MMYPMNFMEILRIGYLVINLHQELIKLVYKIKIFQSFKDTVDDLVIKYNVYIDGVGVTD